MSYIRGYRPNKNKGVWNEFVDSSEPRMFQFRRNYMDYHSDRFKDCSAIIFNDQNEIEAIFPANLIKDGQKVLISSHSGLSFGGLLIGNVANISAEDLENRLDLITNFYKQEIKAHSLSLKLLPSFYYRQEKEDWVYILKKNGFNLNRVDITTVVDLANPNKFSSRRVRGIKKALKAGVSCSQSNNWSAYWKILHKVLKDKHNVKPTHTIDEIIQLKTSFVNNINLFGAFNQDKEMIAGVVIYEYMQVSHAQYIASSDEGKMSGALDLLFNYLITLYRNKNEYRYFDFGVSSESNGLVLNYGLKKFKEEFGGISKVHQSWLKVL